MLDKQYFSEQYKEQVKHLSKGNGVTMRINLRGCTELIIHEIIKAHANYVLLSVYPNENSNNSTGNETLDSIALPYSSIDYVLLTTSLQSKTKFGFAAAS